METFSRLAYESVTTAHESSIELHIHTFACPLCPDFIKVEDCLSDGKYCAYFPKKNDYWIEDMDSEDYSQAQGDLEYADFTGRQQLLATLKEKCLHQLIRRDVQDLDEDAEMIYFVEIEKRLKQCFINGHRTQSYGQECLFSTPIYFDSYAKEIDQCVEESFSTPGDYESENSIFF